MRTDADPRADLHQRALAMAARGGAVANRCPAANWGYFKVPGCWPGITDYMQKDCQTVYAHPSWASRRLSDVTAAWYEREIAIPADWAEPSHRALRRVPEFLCGRVRGWREGGRSSVSRRRGGPHLGVPAGRHAQAQPARGRHAAQGRHALLHATAPRPGRSRAPWRGAACAAMSTWSSTPSGPRIADVRVDTSVRKREITFDAAVEGLAADAQYALRAQSH